MSQYIYKNPLTKRYLTITSIKEYSNISIEEMRSEYYMEMHYKSNNSINNKQDVTLNENSKYKKPYVSETENVIIMSDDSSCESNDFNYDNENINNNEHSVTLNESSKFKKPYVSKSENLNVSRRKRIEETIIMSNNDTSSKSNKSKEPYVSETENLTVFKRQRLVETLIPESEIKMNLTSNSKRIKSKLTSLKENEPIKRGYFSETEDSRLFKKMKIEKLSDNESSDEENICDNSLMHDISFNEKFDLLTASIGEKVKRNVNTRKTKRKCLRTAAENGLAEEKRMLEFIDKLRKEGNVLVKQCEYVKAYDIYTKAISYCNKYRSMSSLCYSNRAFCLLKMEKVVEALDDCVSATNFDDKNWKAYLRKIKCLIDLKRYNEAEKEAQTFNSTWKIEEGRQLLATITSAMRLDTLRTNGDKLLSEERFSEALDNFSEAISIDSGDSTLYGKRASVLFLLARYNESLSNIDEALSLTPDNESLIRTRIECLVKLERFHEATKDAQKLQSRTPSHDNEQILYYSIKMERQANDRNHYQILGVTQSASQSEIKKRYRKLTLLYHPDKLINCEPEAKAIQEDKFKQLTKIYSTLSDPVSRRMYDIELRYRR